MEFDKHPVACCFLDRLMTQENLEGPAEVLLALRAQVNTSKSSYRSQMPIPVDSWGDFTCDFLALIFIYLLLLSVRVCSLGILWYRLEIQGG